MELAEMGSFFDGEWESLSNVFTFDEPGFRSHHQFLSHHTDESTFVAPFTDNEYFYSNLSSILPHTSISNFHIDNASDTTSYHFSSQTTTNSYENCHFSLPNEVVTPCMMDQGNLAAIAASNVSAFPTSLDVNGSNDSPIEAEDNESYILASTLNTKVHEKRKKIAHEVLKPDNNVVPKKKSRVSNNNGKMIIESTESKEDDDSNVGVETTKTDQESMASPQTNEEEILASKGKNRASRGTSTDSQSLYARKRREKINERLKILQNLVPNGTKVDISTMLEEAVQYVKFLQLQIRLLSSDDLWMYAPIAYNGVDISLYKRISPFLIP